MTKFELLSLISMIFCLQGGTRAFNIHCHLENHHKNLFEVVCEKEKAKEKKTESDPKAGY